MMSEFKQRDGETWRDVVARIGKEAHVQLEVLEAYDFFDSNMQDKKEAAWMALYEWDAL